MPVIEEALISPTLGVPALAACGSLFRWKRRPRLFWSDWALQGGDGLYTENVGGEDIERCALRDRPERGPISRWVNQGSRWAGASEEHPCCVPTLMRCKHKKTPPWP